MKYIWWVVGSIILIGILVTIVLLRPMTPPPTTSNADTNATDTPAKTDNTDTTGQTVALASGRYQDYSADLVKDTSFDTTILFFYAAWCPECRGYDQAIKAADLPDGVQILKLNYDDVQDQRQQYGVTIQSTFVRVNASGEKQTLWNGYGKEKSLDAILENTK